MPTNTITKDQIDTLLAKSKFEDYRLGDELGIKRPS